MFRDKRIDVESLVPSLRTQALLLTGSESKADELVEEALRCAIAEADSLDLGRDIEQWLIGIMMDILMTSFHKGTH